MKPVSKLDGQRFGRLVVAERVWPNAKGNTRWRCVCDCGNASIVTAAELRRSTKSCGCLRRERALESVRTHGRSGTPVYGVWYGMMRRCYERKHKDYSRYGARGIAVCARWRDFTNFYADMGGPPAGLTIERLDNDGPYSPENCEWASRAKQGANTSQVRHVTIDGERMTLRAAAEKRGLKPDTVYMRVHRGLSIEEALK
jgi:hypothetical protein